MPKSVLLRRQSSGVQTFRFEEDAVLLRATISIGHPGAALNNSLATAYLRQGTYAVGIPSTGDSGTLMFISLGSFTAISGGGVSQSIQLDQRVYAGEVFTFGLTTAGDPDDIEAGCVLQWDVVRR